MLRHEAGEVLGDAAGIPIQSLEPDPIVICGPGTRAMDLLTEGVVMQALRELDSDLAWLKAA